MAFGKNPENLERVSSFREQVQMQKKNEQRNFSGNRLPYFINQYRPPTDVPDKIRIIPGDYTIASPVVDSKGGLVLGPDGQPLSKEQKHMYFFPTVEHYNSSLKKGFICSGGTFHAYKKYASPCGGCEAYYQGNKQKSYMSKRNLYVLTILVFGEYAAVPIKNQQTGELLLNQHTGKPIFNWEKVTRQNRVEYTDFTKRDWVKKPWAISWQHWNTLAGFSQNVSRSCVNCETKDSISTVAFNCESCGEVVIDMDTTTLADKDIEKTTSGKVVCPSCKHDGYLTELIACSSCENALRAEIFDIDIKVLAQEDNSSPTVKKVSLILDFIKPSKLDRRFTVSNPDYNDQPIAFPMALDKQYAPYPYETQGDYLMGGGKAVNPSEMSRAYTKR